MGSGGPQQLQQAALLGRHLLVQVLQTLTRLARLASLELQQSQLQLLGWRRWQGPIRQLLLQPQPQGLKGMLARQGPPQAGGQAGRGQGCQLLLAQLQVIANRRPLQAVHQSAQPEQATEHKADQGQSGGPPRAPAGSRGGIGVQPQALQGLLVLQFWTAPFPYDGYEQPPANVPSDCVGAPWPQQFQPGAPDPGARRPLQPDRNRPESGPGLRGGPGGSGFRSRLQLPAETGRRHHQVAAGRTGPGPAGGI